MKIVYWIVWPSFLAAGAAEFLFFTLINPRELYLLGEPVHFSEIATYSLGFFLFWAMCLMSSLATCFFQRSGPAINAVAAPDAAPSGGASAR